MGLALLIDRGELSFRSPHEVFETLKIPVVGRIPYIQGPLVKPEHGDANLIAAHKPASTAAESFRSLRTELFFRSNAERLKTFLFTSPSPGDGKSTMVSNFSISIARAGKRVVLVDADLRRPRVHKYFGEDIGPGLTDVLAGEVDLKNAVHPSKLQDGLYLLTSGVHPKDPGEIVSSGKFQKMIAALKKKFDFVLIDSPPVIPVADALSMGCFVDGVYLVTRVRKGSSLTSRKAKESLDRVNVNWMGVIINEMDRNPHYSEYGYQYGSYSYYSGAYGRYNDLAIQAYRDNIIDESEVG